ncbi:MAG: exodeoxyribonuclease VII large subunit [Candidatus Methanoperedens sp.]|nr:exodeoxyribonuclease VII large subunit [Candidatus Methanoperedens sp.]
MFFEEKGIYTVHEFTQAIKAVLISGNFNDVWIRGEVSNFKNHSSGHRYFTLKDKSSSVQCVMFKWYGQNLRFELEHGMKVLILGDLDVYEQKGQYQLKVRMIRPDGIGELYKAYEQLKNRLEKEGLFSPLHKRPLPAFPEKIGVATSETAQAVYNSRIPVISAIGHETDYTIADFVADKRAPTPSAAAEIAVPEKNELLGRISMYSNRLIQHQRRYITDRTSYVRELKKRVDLHLFRERLVNYMQYLDEIVQRQTQGIQRMIEIKRAMFSAHAGKLDAVSPLATLSRGYSIALKLPGKTLVRSVNDVEKMDEVQIIVNDGKIRCDVKDKEACIWK